MTLRSVAGVFMRHGAPPLPRWARLSLIPLLNLLFALFCTGILIALLGENPFAALSVMLKGVFVYDGGIGFTLYYATNLIFTGLCMAIASQAMQFNIGGEGQAMIGGLFCGLLILVLGEHVPLVVMFPLAVAAAAIGGGIWGFIPGYLYAKRGSHVVITTIMFNFIAAAILQYLLVKVLIAPGQMSPKTVAFAEQSHLPYLHEMAGWVGLEVARSPANFAFVLALAVAVLTWVMIWRTPWGFAVRTVGQSESAAVYSGIKPTRVVMQAMFFSGAMAGLLGINALMGEHHLILLSFATGYGFAGIGVALMGRNHPVGVVLAALLFGILIQGGSELDFEFKLITRDLVVVIQGLIILFTGALSQLFEPPVARLLHRWRRPASEVTNG